VTAVRVRVGDVAPAKFVNVAPPLVLTCHCAVGAGVPLAAAVNVALAPARTVTFTGLVVIAGAELTVSSAGTLVTLFVEFVKTASYEFPFIAAVTAVIVRVVEVAPGIEEKLAPLFVLTCHCTVGAGDPDAVDVNVALAPTATDTPAGCVAIAAGKRPGVVVVLELAQPPTHKIAISARTPSIWRAPSAANPDCANFSIRFRADGAAESFMAGFPPKWVARIQCSAGGAPASNRRIPTAKFLKETVQNSTRDSIGLCDASV
jgi:hypothetical protein